MKCEVKSLTGGGPHSLYPCCCSGMRKVGKKEVGEIKGRAATEINIQGARSGDMVNKTS